MDIQTLSNVINNFLRDVNKDLKIQKLTVTQERLYVEYEPQEIELNKQNLCLVEQKRKPWERKYTPIEEIVLKISRKRAKDPRIKAILEANPTMTFAQWVGKEYPGTKLSSVRNVIRKHPELPVRKCIDLLRARS